MENDEKIIEHSLFIKEDEKKLSLQEVADLIKPFLRIDPENKSVLFTDDWNHLSNYERIPVLLTAQYIGNIAKVFDHKFLNLPKISEHMGDIQTTLSGPLNRLIKDRIVIPNESKPRTYHINEVNIRKFLTELNRTQKKKNG